MEGRELQFRYIVKAGLVKKRTFDLSPDGGEGVSCLEVCREGPRQREQPVQTP